MNIIKRGKGQGADLNLVPYIDLLTCMIAFLLITAVWTQLARLQVRHVEHGGEHGLEDPTRVTVLVGEQGFNVLVEGTTQMDPQAISGFDLPKLRQVLDRVKAALPDQEDLLVASADGVAYDTLVGAMDTALSAGFPTLSLQPASP